MRGDVESKPGSAVVDIISRMHDLNERFAKREQRVADYVLANLELVSHQRQSEIAAAAEVSEATVTRFCQSLGCEGFRDFRIRFAQSLAVSLQYLRAEKVAEGDKEQLVDQVFDSITSMLANARHQLDLEQVSAATEMLAAARRIAFFGVGGNSSNLASEGANRFFRLGFPAECHADGYYQRMLASTLSSGDVVFAISSSGTPAELLDSVAIASQYGAGTIALTKTGSPLAKATNISIELDLIEDADVYKPTASRLAYFAVLDVLAAGVARARADLSRENLRRIRTSFVQFNAETSPTPIGD